MHGRRVGHPPMSLEVQDIGSLPFAWVESLPFAWVEAYRLHAKG